MTKYRMFFDPEDYYIDMDIYEEPYRATPTRQRLVDAVVAGVKAAGGTVQKITEIREVEEL